jgi:hypothetical protein
MALDGHVERPGGHATFEPRRSRITVGRHQAQGRYSQPTQTEHQQCSNDSENEFARTFPPRSLAISISYLREVVPKPPRNTG